VIIFDFMNNAAIWQVSSNPMIINIFTTSNLTQTTTADFDLCVIRYTCIMMRSHHVRFKDRDIMWHGTVSNSCNLVKFKNYKLDLFFVFFAIALLLCPFFFTSNVIPSFRGCVCLHFIVKVHEAKESYLFTCTSLNQVEIWHIFTGNYYETSHI
jgi:hypothetical protein